MENLKIEKKQEEKLQEEVKNEQDEEVEDEVDDGLGETTGDEEEEKKDAKEPGKDGAKSRKKPRKKKATKAEKEAKQEAHFQLVMEAARTVVRILKDRGIECAVFGSLAARLYGSYRCPKASRFSLDVDMLVLQDPSIPPEQQLTAEQLKVLFLDTSPLHFYLKLPRNPEDTYRILYYRREYLGVDCKVDILIPGTMYLPHTLPPNDEQTATRWVDGIPLVPFGLLLLHKLQGWDDHRLAEEEFRQKKQVQDAADVKKILGMDREVNKLVKTVSAMNENRWWKDPILFSEEFRDLTKRRVDDYCKEFQDRSKAWKKLGFDVPDSAPQPSKSNSKPSKPESTVEAPAPPETQPHQEAEVGQVLSPPAPHQLDLQPHPEPESAQSATGIGRTRSVSIPMPPLPRAKEVLDGIVTEGTLFTPELDDPVSPDEIVCRVGGLTGAPEIVPVVSGGGLSAIPATVPVVSAG
ncbi:hypothetical protein BKA70DRAFT_1116869 [Coprinopsis sp. MPI-PUGE-AT-0042]|nr:hypothetical protein BKA70DRAFT_1116869 [Coprinopsis sp. MPI-PUGE-AT-0042]